VSRENRVLLVGQAPSRSSDQSEPLSGASGKRLARLFGLEPDEYLAHPQLVRMNMLRLWSGRGARRRHTDAFDMAKAELVGRRKLCERVHRERPSHVLLMGRMVAKAASCPEDFFEWKEAGFALGCSRVSSLVAVFPHPSGLSRFWRSDENNERARRFLENLI